MKLANERLRRDFPEAPLLAAADLQSARKHAEGRTEIVLERRRVAPDRNPFSFVHARIERPSRGEARVTVKAHLVAANAEPLSKAKPPKRLVNLCPAAHRHRSLGQVRLRHRLRPHAAEGKRAAQLARGGRHPLSMDARGDLMLLHPDGSEEVLVPAARGRSPTRSSPSTANGSTIRCSRTLQARRDTRAARPPTSTRFTSRRGRSSG